MLESITRPFFNLGDAPWKLRPFSTFSLASENTSPGVEHPPLVPHVHTPLVLNDGNGFLEPL